jgi:outer membrane protein OmpA-like peptidoglycan-associated protein
LLGRPFRLEEPESGACCRDVRRLAPIARPCEDQLAIRSNSRRFHMKTFPLSAAIGLAMCVGAQEQDMVADTTAPTLGQSVSIGAGVGGQHYDGSFGNGSELYGKLFVKYNPGECLGARLSMGVGNVGNGAYETEWLSHAGLEAVLQPKIDALGGFRPYLASGVSTTFGSSTVKNAKKKAINQDLDWNLYAPLELGLEYLINDNFSVFAWAETYLHMDKWDKLDGVQSRGEYFDKRDDLYKAGVGLSFRFSVKPDTDKDGVTDELDKCPATPVDVKIDRRGCPLDEDQDAVPDYLDKCSATPRSARVDAGGCPLDEDKDGVADYLDKCPNTPAGVSVTVAGCPVDEDKDGVADYLDKCQNTPAGVKVDKIGCPVPLDTDKDGVLDSLDKCPNTPAGVKVDQVGCPVPEDSDRDGVVDNLDKCPGTRLGTKVDAEGCDLIVIEKGTKLTLAGIEFKSGSSDIDPVSIPVLLRAASALEKAPEAKVEIAGFTDNLGRVASNTKLSQKRAESVMNYLIKLGASARQLSAVGYGSAQPVADNATEEGRKINRRIEFRVK